ncbi:MAG: polyprenyl synthetase family protein [Nitrospirae bacterium]|nr:MAG: polyprenyl synthetase family protein [Nitrospirota bacterium]
MDRLVCDINDVFTSYSEELKRVEEELLGLFQSDAFLIPAIGNHIVKSGGKRLRPLFLILSSELCGYREHSRIVLASIIEAIHTASLLHDDVVDGAELRRGKPTAHSIWGNQIVVLVGDYLYSNALRIAVSQRSQAVMEVLSRATTQMTEGELLQLSKIGDPEVKEDEYLKIISSKTGALISAACQIGGILADETEQRINALKEYGMKTGIAFQMVDDILDFMADEEGLGKRLGKDLDEGKITMPLILLLRRCDERERERVKEIINNNDSITDQSLSEILKLFRKYQTIDASMARAQEFVEEAKRALEPFPMSRQKEELFCLAEYALLRRK